MDTSEIELFAESTDLGYADKDPYYYVLGVLGEAGEIAELFKKRIRSGEQANFQDELGKEIADCQWYLARLANAHGLTLAECWEKTVDKLTARHKDGYYK